MTLYNFRVILYNFRVILNWPETDIQQTYPIYVCGISFRGVTNSALANDMYLLPQAEVYNEK